MAEYYIRQPESEEARGPFDLQRIADGGVQGRRGGAALRRDTRLGDHPGFAKTEARGDLIDWHFIVLPR